MLKPNKLIVHASATRPEWMEGQPLAAKCEEIERWHRERGFSGIGYHFAIDRNGDLMHCRPMWRQGAHCRDKGQNRQSLGVLLIGGYGGARDDLFFDHFTTSQHDSVSALIEKLDLPVYGHNEFSNKACPCFNVQEVF